MSRAAARKPRVARKAARRYPTRDTVVRAQLAAGDPAFGTIFDVDQTLELLRVVERRWR